MGACEPAEKVAAERLAEEAVTCEPVSSAKIPCEQGKEQGIF